MTLSFDNITLYLKFLWEADRNKVLSNILKAFQFSFPTHGEIQSVRSPTNTLHTIQRKYW